jgi:hypothetical protein
MRWLRRSLLFWAISMPLFYLFGLPALLDMLTTKARNEGYTQCSTQMKSEGLVGSANSPVTPDQGEKYCRCLSDGLIFSKNDLFDMVQKKPPAALTALAQSLADSCNRDLQHMMGFLPPAATPAAAPNSDIITIE